ncbi:cilia- and flagella-associated protein 161 isoform X2 [Paramormyrops kingsleyae]|nr:cilia- and flagella-associated protein 161 isoform X2 [Paramormyrops kingsleyae]
MAGIRTYGRHVRVGNWSEDVVLDEEMLKDFLEKKEKGELVFQKTNLVKQNMLKKIDLTVTTDGWLHFGDVVILVNPGGDQGEHSLGWQTKRDAAAVSMHLDPSSAAMSSLTQTPREVTATRAVESCGRTAFVVTSVDGTPEGETVKYNQSFAFRLKDAFAGELYLASDQRTFLKCARRSRLQEVSLSSHTSFFTCWQVVYLDPQERMENEGLPVPVNKKVLITHCKTNQCLAVLGNYVLWTAYGKEYEVVAQTFLDSHKAEREMNHWLLVTADPAVQGQAMTDRPHAMAAMSATEDSQHRGTEGGAEEEQNMYVRHKTLPRSATSEDTAGQERKPSALTGRG